MKALLFALLTIGAVSANLSPESSTPGDITSVGPDRSGYDCMELDCLLIERYCEPGTIFKHYCNNCTCQEDRLVRTAVCTKMGCAPGMWNADGSSKRPEDEINYQILRNRYEERTKVCDPNAIVIDGCYCAHDGYAMFCGAMGTHNVIVGLLIFASVFVSLFSASFYR